MWLSSAGGLIPADEPAVSVRDRGLLLGDGLFETARIYGGRLPLLGRHLRRLAEGAAVLGIPVPPGVEEAASETVAACGVRDGVLRITLTRGPGPRGLDLPPEPTPTLLVQAEPLAAPAPGPVRAALVSLRRDSRSPLSRLKTTSGLPSVLARAEARAAGAGEALLLNTEGFLAEGAATNLFWVRDGVLHTPATTAGCLPGIARGLVLELARSLALPVVEGLFLPDDLAAADEAFLTSALLEVAPLAEVTAAPAVPVPWEGPPRWPAPGPVTSRLAAAYREYTT